MNEEIKIEKGIAIPTTSYGSKYPFAEMEVGDSFLVSGTQANSVIYSMSKFANVNPTKKFSSRREGENSRRVWRIK